MIATQNKTSIKCSCGLANKVFCPRCSKLRMIILLKNGNDNLKYSRANGDLSNPVWYSPLKHNRLDIYRIAEKMEKRLREHPQLSGAAQCLQFYINGNRQNYIKKVDM